MGRRGRQRVENCFDIRKMMKQYESLYVDVKLPMHVVIIDGDVSYPATSGKRLRTLNLMLQAAKRHRITYIGRCAPDSEEARLRSGISARTQYRADSRAASSAAQSGAAVLRSAGRQSVLGSALFGDFAPERTDAPSRL